MAPVDIQSVPSWPQYSKDEPKLMEIGSTLKMVGVPDRDREQLVKGVLLAARQNRIEDEKLTDCPMFDEQKSVKVFGSSFHWWYLAVLSRGYSISSFL